METLSVHSHNNTILNDRVLWYDGDSTVKSENVLRILSGGQSPIGIWVESLTDDIIQYNRFVPSEEQIKIKKNVGKLNTEWYLPEEYASIDPWNYVVDKFFDGIRGKDITENTHMAANRLTSELLLYTKLGLLDVLRALIYIINTLEKNKVVWGVGRGSSVSSYVLYIIGVHDVDSVEYDLDIADFLRIK